MATWPLNLDCYSMFPGAQRRCAERLAQRKNNLFCEKDSETVVLVKDVHCNGQIAPADLRSKKEIADWLERCPSLRNQNNKDGPASRFVYYHGPTSRDRLRCTHDVFTTIAAANNVMPEYMDVLCDFGLRAKASDPASYAFRGNTRLSRPCGSLGDFPKGHELSYMLRNPNFRQIRATNQEPTTTWSLRPLAIYHQFHAEDNRSLWLITRGDTNLYLKKKEFLQDLVKAPFGCQTPRSRFRAACATHLFFIRFSLENWDTYLDVLDVRKEELTGIAIFGTRKKTSFRKEFRVGDLGPTQDLQEEIQRAMLALEGNQKMLKAISSFYEELFADPKTVPKADCRDVMTAFRREIRQLELDFQAHHAKAVSMRDATSGRKELILQYLQGQTTERTEELTIETRNVALDSQHEAVIMRIITVVTLLFLPATFVSTFFSTDIWKFDDDDSDLGNYSGPAFRFWGAITGPLTLAVLITAGIFYLRSYYKKRDAKRKGMYDEEKAGLPTDGRTGRRSCLEAAVTCSIHPLKCFCSREKPEGPRGFSEKGLRLLPSDRTDTDHTNRTGTHTTTLFYRNELTAEPQSS